MVLMRAHRTVSGLHSDPQNVILQFEFETLECLPKTMFFGVSVQPGNEKYLKE